MSSTVLKFDDKLVNTIREINPDTPIGETVRRAVALLKIAEEGKAAGQRLYLIDAETRKEIVL